MAIKKQGNDATMFRNINPSFCNSWEKENQPKPTEIPNYFVFTKYCISKHKFNHNNSMIFYYYLIKYTPFLPKQAALLQPLSNYPGHHTMLLFLHSLGFRSQHINYSPHKEHPEINLYATFSPLMISRNTCFSLFLLLSNH